MIIIWYMIYGLRILEEASEFFNHAMLALCPGIGLATVGKVAQP